MKNLICASEVTLNITDVAEAKEELGRFAQWLEDLFPKLLDFILQVALAFVVIVIGMKVIGWVRKILRKSLERSEADTGLIQFLDSLVKYALYLVLGLSVLQKFGVQTTSIVAAIGSLGVAIGLALQGSLSNFAGGVIILLLKPFKAGDYIVQGSLEGSVSEIQLFYTTLLTGDNRKVVIPNGQLADNSLINVTSSDTRRLDIKVGISYNADIKLAKEILLNLANSDADVLQEEGKAPMAVVENLGESSVDMMLRVWTPTDKYWDVKFRLNEAVKLSYDEAGIEIPFNQLDVHLINS
ncbi:MAG: mechanosensitive ion channel family protein [Lachnospiraceae bacterium]|nr:mechanosensitive ion channel family protein [Lachnospiraceae bacterium]